MLNALAALSLLVCIAACALWLRGYFIGDAIYVNLPQFGDPLADNTVSIRSGRGGVAVSVQRWAAWESGTRRPSRNELHPRRVVRATFSPFYPYALNRTIFKRFGFELSRVSETPGANSVGSGMIDQFNFVAPAGVIAAIAAILPVWWVRRWRRDKARGRAAARFCVVCSYDLRATPERCPECGTVPAAAVPHSGQRSGVARRS